MQSESDTPEIATLRAAAEGGDVAAMNALAQRYVHGDGVPLSGLEAARLFRLASNWEWLAIAHMCYVRVGDPYVGTTTDELIQGYQALATRGEVNAQYMLGFFYEHGQDETQAQYWYGRAADQGHLSARAKLRVTAAA
jgi:uncharacterized protein